VLAVAIALLVWLVPQRPGFHANGERPSG
jgi:hypothetical protein